MVVLGGDAVHGALLALCRNVWCSGKLPEPWNEARTSYLHKKRSKTEVSNYRHISLISVLAKAVTKPWVGCLQDIAADHLKVPRRIVAIEIRQGTSQISRTINFLI